ncbi:hypothetical protein D3C81_1938290 [compost metagenome]
MVIGSCPEIMFYVAQCVIHPAHIPFVVESQSSLMYRSCNPRPGAGLLCHHQSFWIIAENGLIETLNKPDCLQIFQSPVCISAVFVLFLFKIQSEHAGDRVHPHSVNMIHLKPEQCVRNQK